MSSHSGNRFLSTTTITPPDPTALGKGAGSRRFGDDDRLGAIGSGVDHLEARWPIRRSRPPTLVQIFGDANVQLLGDLVEEQAADADREGDRGIHARGQS